MDITTMQPQRYCQKLYFELREDAVGYGVVLPKLRPSCKIGSIVSFEKADWNDKKKRIIVVNNFKYILLNQTTYVINNYV